jgi:tetratricopeptide (TPR) repeat protein
MVRIVAASSFLLCLWATSVSGQAPAPADTADQAYVEALALHLAGRHDEAISRGAGAAQTDLPWRRDTLAYVQARSAAARGKAGEAVARLTRLAEATPRSPLAADALLDCARYQRLRGDTDAAVELCETVRSWNVSPRIALAALLEQGLAQERDADFDRAVVSFDQLRIEASRLPARQRQQRVARRFASKRKQIILDAMADTSQAIVRYNKARREARHGRSRNQALLELITLAGLYPDSPLLDDSLVERVRIHLLKGDDASARQMFRQLLNGPLSELSDEPVRSCSMTMARWLLADADRRIASLADVFPELFGYAPGHLVETPRADGTVAHTLTFRRSSGPLKLSLEVIVARPTGGEAATYPGLNLRVTTTVKTGSEMLSHEIAEALTMVSANLERLEHAVSGTPTDASVTDDDGQTETPPQ